MASITLNERVSGIGKTVGNSNVYTADGGVHVDALIEADAVNAEVLVAFNKDDLAFLLITADGDVTMEVNDGEGVGGTVALKANEPFIFKSEEASYVTLTEMGITADVTGLFFTEENSVDVNVAIRFAHDATV